jgi:uncharacterized protein
MADELAADDVRKLLDLEPNATCGFVRITYVSPQSIAAGGLPSPFGDGRPVGSALYFMVTPTAPVRLHRIRNDQLYHYYLGDPLEVFLLRNDGTSELVIVGPDLRGGERIQLFIPGNTFHTARVMGRRRWFLGASTEWPGVVPADVEIGDVNMNWPRSIRGLPLTCAPSPSPSGRVEVRLRAVMASPFSRLAPPSRRGSARAG